MEEEEKFSKEHPLKIKDTDIFLHGTSSKKYSAIQSKGFMLGGIPERNYPISGKVFVLKNMLRVTRLMSMLLYRR